MRLSPDQMIFWQHGFLKLNATIVFTWALMLVLAVGSLADHPQALSRICSAPAGRTCWKSSSSASRSRSKRSACRSRRNISAFWARCSCSSPPPASAPSFPATNRRPARYRPPRRWRCACLWPCRCSASRSRGWAAISSPTPQPTVMMLPFNLISELSRTLALAVRLFGNMMSGVMIIGILLSITPFIFPIVMTALGLLTGMVQAYIFSILAAVYIAAATALGRSFNPRIHSGQHDTHCGGIDRHRRNHHRFRLHGPGARRGTRGRHRADLPGAATRRFRRPSPGRCSSVWP